MSVARQYITNVIMIYSLVVIAISAANISYSSENPDYPVPDPQPTTNSTSNNTTGCNIYNIHQVSYGFAIGHIVLAMITILGCMCVQTSKKQFDSSELHEIPAECWVVISAIVVSGCLTLATLSYGSNLDKPYYKDIGGFSAHGCNPVRIRLIYASLLITGLPAILFGIVLGLFIVGGIIYWSVYAIISWLRTFEWGRTICCDCSKFWADVQNQPAEQPPNHGHTTNSGARTIRYTRPQSLNAIKISKSVKYSELQQQQPSTTVVIQPLDYSETES